MSQDFPVPAIGLLALTGIVPLFAETLVATMERQTVRVETDIRIEVLDAPLAGKQLQIMGHGSSFVIGDGRHVVTNNHVCCKVNTEIGPFTVEGRRVGPLRVREVSRQVFLRLAPGEKGRVPVKVIWNDPHKDLGVLELDEKLDRPAVTAALTGAVEKGQTVFAYGFPSASETGEESRLEVKVTRGIISAKDRGPEGHLDADVYLTDTPINKGNSGGPLFDECGRVVGVNTLGVTMVGVEGVNWAVRVDELVGPLKELKIGLKSTTKACAAAGGIFPILISTQIATLLVALGAVGLAMTKRGRNYVSHQVKRYTQRRSYRPAPDPFPHGVGRLVLKGISGYYAGSTLELSDEPLVLGRDPRAANLVFPPDSSVSKRHCILRYNRESGTVSLEDAWSANGTFFGDGQAIDAGSRTALKPGERFYLGDPGTMFEVGGE